MDRWEWIQTCADELPWPELQPGTLIILDDTRLLEVLALSRRDQDHRPTHLNVIDCGHHTRDGSEARTTLALTDLIGPYPRIQARWRVLRAPQRPGPRRRVDGTRRAR